MRLDTVGVADAPGDPARPWGVLFAGMPFGVL